MITKERLEELIKEGATIWWLPGKMALKICLNDSYYVDYQDMLCCKRLNYNERIEHISWLFETEEQAEWHLKYHKNRIETLDLLMWEDFIKEDNFVFKFYVKKKEYSMYIFVKNKNTNNCRILIRADDREQDWLVFEEPATEENYIKACDLCLKLFEGEK